MEADSAKTPTIAPCLLRDYAVVALVMCKEILEEFGNILKPLWED